MSGSIQERSEALAALNRWFREQGQDVSASSIEAWNVTQYGDALVFSPGQGRRSNRLYMVRSGAVAAFTAATNSLEDVYRTLR